MNLFPCTASLLLVTGYIRGLVIRSFTEPLKSDWIMIDAIQDAHTKDFYELCTSTTFTTPSTNCLTTPASDRPSSAAHLCYSEIVTSSITCCAFTTGLCIAIETPASLCNAFGT